MNSFRASARPWVIGFGATASVLGLFLVIADQPAEIAAEVAARVADGKKPRPESDFALGLWWAALANLVVCLALLSAVRLWARQLPVPDGRIAIPRGKFSQALLFGLLGTMALGGAFRWNLAHRSLWWDELWAAKYGIVGYYIGDAKTPLEERRFGEGSWQRSLWHYTRPMNHPAASFPARLSHVGWSQFVKPDSPHEFSDFAVRFPNWLASLAAIGAVGAIGALWGRPLGGLFAALLLAAHPWHMRYGVDLRGYSWLILWTAMGLVWLTLLFCENKARWWPWWAFGVNQALLVWSFPHGAKIAGLFCITAAVLIPRLWRAREDRFTAWFRLLLMNVVAAMLYLQIFGPNLLQITHWWEENAATHSDHPLDTDLFVETLCRLVSGSPWVLANAAEFPQLSTAAHPVWTWASISVLATAFLVGLCRREKLANWLLLAPVATGVVMLIWFALVDTYYYSRFMTFLVVPFSLAIGLAVDWRPPASRFRILAAVVVAISFVTLAAPQWRVLMERPYAPMRDVAAVLNAEGDRSLVVCYGHGSEMLPLYAPRVRAASSLAELQALTEEAAAGGKGLLVAYGYPALNRQGIPDGFQWLDDPSLFEPEGEWTGIDPDFVFRVLRWTGKNSDQTE